MTQPDPARRDRTTVHRGLAAGAAVAAAVGVPVAGAVLLGGGVPAAALAGVLLGLIAGGVVATGWILLGTLLDLLAGGRPGGYRAVWLLVLVVATGLLPVVLLGVEASLPVP